MNEIKKYLVWFAHENIDFKLPELEAIAEIENVKIKWLNVNLQNPFALLESNENGMRKIAERSVTIKFIVELWAYAEEDEELVRQLKKCEYRTLSENCSENKSYKIVVESFGKKLPFNEQLQKIEQFSFLNFRGAIDLRNPENIFYCIEFYGLDPNDVPDKPFSIFFGKWITDGQRNLINELNLKTRKFISNTSMDPTMSLLMNNIAKVKELDFVFDPFVGSGSVLIPAAKFGAFVLGTDIDYMLMYGKSKPSRCGVNVRQPDETIYSNLQQYDIESKYIDVIVADSSLPLWRDNFQFDAIVTDPPYGIREASEKIGSEKKYKIPAHLCEGHIPSKIRYNFTDIAKDLMEFAAHHLKKNGRLVYWIPQPKLNSPWEVDANCSHPCFTLIAKCEQILSKNSSRLLVCLEKHKEPFESVETE